MYDFLDFSLAEAKQQDLDDIMHIEHNSFTETVVESRNVFSERINVFSKGFLLLRYKDKTVGYFCTELWKDCKLPYSTADFALGHSASALYTPKGSSLYIASMGILPEFRGGGIGKFLFSASLEKITSSVPTVKKHILLVNETWLPARTIYKKAGFNEVQILENFFDTKEKTPQNGIIMERLYNKY